MIEFYIVVSVVVLLLIIRAVRRKGTPAAGTVAGAGAHRWYQNISPAQWLTTVLWLIGVALVWLVVNKFWGTETKVVWGEWSSSRENLWITILSLALLGGVVIKAALMREKHTGGTSAQGARNGLSVGGVFSAFVGIAALVLLVSLAGLSAFAFWHEIEFGLSNAPERFAERGYVTREQVAAVLAASAPALPEVHIITAPPLEADGTTNWSETVTRESVYHHLYFNIPDEAEQFILKRADGVVTNFSAATRAREIEFASLTNAFTIKWWQSKRKLTPQEITALEEK